MSLLDWLLVIGLNGSIILYAVARGRDTKTSGDWFLARRSLPWWIVGLSMYATAIDASDMVADSGGTYRFGVSMFVINWVGVVLGWFLMTHFIALPMYRSGMYTNAEYLEARFGPTARITSAIIQVLYRTVVMGILGTTVYLTLSIVAGWNDTFAWAAVVVIALLATVYTMIGGLRSVAITDALQSIVMLTASVLLFLVVYSAIGGWSGMTEKLDAKDPSLARHVLHVGSGQVDEIDVRDWPPLKLAAFLRLGGVHDAQQERIVRRTPGWLVSIYFIVAGLAYAIVNHTQSMRMFGARSEWDLKMSVVVAGTVIIAVTFLNLSMGIMGRALFNLTRAETDHVFPLIVREYTTVGMRGIVVAGIMAASFSTYDSIGSTLSALLTRDVYARLFVSDRDDEHYLRVGRWLTPVIIFGSFVYVPFLLSEGMVFFYLDIVGTFVVPLLTVYLMGALTRVHQRSAVWGLAAGVGYGICYLLCEPIADRWHIAILISPLTNAYAAYPISMLFTAGAMILTSLVLGWEQPQELRQPDRTGWLQTSRLQVQHLVQQQTAERSYLVPTGLSVLVVALGLVLSFVVFW